MIDKDDEEEKGTFGASRYPCMPSLVALQQMRNRLHLAHLGKKLMKWTAMATARELRRICFELRDVYQTHTEDVKDCYIMLARSRYYYPTLNNVVLENIPNKASMTLASSSKTVSGVRIFLWSCEDSGKDNYEHLGLDKGGDTIKETKIKWKNLLMDMVKICELKTSFRLVEAANKSATKRQNVLGKLVIPRTVQSLAYIILELEEKAREELFRIKKVVEYKTKKKAKHVSRKKAEVTPPEAADVPKVSWEPAPVISPPKTPEPEPISVPEAIPVPKEERKPIPLPPVIPEPKPIPLPPVIPEPKPIPLPPVIPEPKPIDITDCCMKAKLEMQQLMEKYKLRDAFEFDDMICRRLQNIRRQIEQIERHSRKAQVAPDFKEPQIEDLSEINICSSCPISIQEQAAPSGKRVILQTDSKVGSLIDEESRTLQNLRKQVAEIEQLTGSISKQVSSKSIDKFLSTCKNFKEKLDEYNEMPRSSNNTVNKLISQLDEAIKLSRAAQKRGLMSDKVSQFIEACEEIKRQLIKPERKPTDVSSDLQTKVDEVVDLLARLRRDGLISASVEKLLLSNNQSNRSYEDRRYGPWEGVLLYDDACSTCDRYTADEFMMDVPSQVETYDHTLEEPACHRHKPTVSAKSSESEKGFVEEMKKTIKVIRTRNADGTVTEEKEIVITTQRNNDSSTSVGEGTSSKASQPVSGEPSNVRYLLVPNINTRGFRKAASSMEIPKNYNLTLKKCISTSATAHTGDKCSYFDVSRDENP